MPSSSHDLPSPSVATPADPSRRGALAGLALAVLLPSLGTSVANVALPTLAESFEAPFQAVQWVVLAYLLAATTLVVSAGRLGDLVGRRRLLLAGTWLFTAASVAGGLAPTLGTLVLARAAQGLGAAVMLALATALVGGAVPKAKIGSAMGLLGSMSALGTSLGPSLGGFLIASLGWRAVFLVNLPLGIATAILLSRGVPVVPGAEPPRRAVFDRAGTLLLAATLAAYALAVTFGRGRFGWPNLVLFAGAIGGVVAFVRVEARAAFPLVELALLRRAALRGGFATSALVSTVMMATLVVGPFYLSRALGLRSVAVGVVMSLGPLVAALVGVPAGRLVDRLGAGRVMSAGLAGIAAGAAALALLPVRMGVIGYVASIVIITVGYASFQAANNTAVMGEIESERRGVVSGLINLSRNLGLITGAAVMAAVFAWASGARDVAAAAPPEVSRGMSVTFAVAALLAAVAWVIARRAPASSRPAR